MRIGLFVTCLTDTLFPDTGKAVVTVLERLGHQVDFPAGQSCCGQMHFNTGYRREAVPHGARLRRRVRRLRGGGDPVGLVRLHGPGVLSRCWPPRRAIPAWPGRWPRSRPGPTSSPCSWPTCWG
jgi:Fe-S oxidoreductase